MIPRSDVRVGQLTGQACGAMQCRVDLATCDPVGASEVVAQPTLWCSGCGSPLVSGSGRRNGVGGPRGQCATLALDARGNVRGRRRLDGQTSEGFDDRFRKAR